MDRAVDGARAVRRAGEFFGGSEDGHIVLVREPDDADLARAALGAGYAPGWTEQSMALHEPPAASPLIADLDLRAVSTPDEVLDYGTVVAEANDDPGERERAGLLFHDDTILAPHIAAFVAYVDGAPVSCAMTLVSHGVAGVFYVATVESARRRGLGDALTALTPPVQIAIPAATSCRGRSFGGEIDKEQRCPTRSRSGPSWRPRRRSGRPHGHGTARPSSRGSVAPACAD